LAKVGNKTVNITVQNHSLYTLTHQKQQISEKSDIAQQYIDT